MIRALKLAILVFILVMLVNPQMLSTDASVIFSADRDSQITASEDKNAVQEIDAESSVRLGESSERLASVKNNLNTQVEQEVELNSSLSWSIVSSSVRTVPSGSTETYFVDTSSVSTSQDSSDYKIITRKGSFLVESERSVQLDDPTIPSLSIVPDTQNSDSNHTWEIPSFTTKTGFEVDTITLDYSGTGASFDGLTDSDAKVILTRNLSGGPDRETISVNSDTYSGESATLDLSGIPTTNVVDDPNNNPNLKVSMDGVTNPPSGSFTANLIVTATDGNGNTSTTTFSDSFTTKDASFFDINILNAPTSVNQSDTFTVDYEVNNSGTSTSTQDIEFRVNGTQESINNGVQLTAGQNITDSFSYSDNTNRQTIEVAVASDNNTERRVINISNRFGLTSEPSTGGIQNANHTWSASDVTFNGEVDTITVSYPSGFSFDGLDNNNVTVTMERQLSSGVDKSEIDINSDTYSGTSATIDLSGNFNTDLVGSLKVEIDGIKNGQASTYQPTITLNGPNDTKSFNASLTTT